MFAFDKTKEYVFKYAHTCTRTYMHVVITCNYSCQHKKIESCMASRAAMIDRLKSINQLMK